MSLKIYMWNINYPALSHIIYKLLNINISARSLASHVMRSGRLIGRSNRNLRREFIIVLILKGTVHVKKKKFVIVYKPGQTPFINVMQLKTSLRDGQFLNGMYCIKCLKLMSFLKLAVLIFVSLLLLYPSLLLFHSRQN